MHTRLEFSGAALNISPNSKEVVDGAGKTFTVSCALSSLSAKVTAVEWKLGATTLTDDSTYTPNVGGDSYDDRAKRQTATLEVAGSDTARSDLVFTCIVTDPSDSSIEEETAELRFYS